MAFVDKEYSDNWAYDISKNVYTEGEIWNDDVIKQSIEMIIATMVGERLFNFRFGCYVWSDLFDNMTQSKGEELIDNVVDAIKLWEDRVVVIENQVQLNVNIDNNSVILIIPYVIKRTGKSDIFKKKIFV